MRARFGIRLLGASVAGLAVAVVAIGTPAWAHIQVSADKPQAGATNVTVTFSGEAESTSAGIKSEQIFLPTGITPSQVSLASGPAGWTLTKGTDNVTVAGNALPVGTDAKYAILVTVLPADATELVFKTIETYGNGEVDRWIDLQQPGQGEPDHPAPVLQLRPAAPTSPSPAPAPTATTAGAAPATTAPATTGATAGGDDNGWLVAVLIVAIIIAGVAGLAIGMRRRTPPNP